MVECRRRISWVPRLVWTRPETRGRGTVGPSPPKETRGGKGMLGKNWGLE